MADPLQQINQLLALAASAEKKREALVAAKKRTDAIEDVLNEARNASYAAVKLMVKHSIQLSLPDPPAQARGTTFPAPSVRATTRSPTRAPARPAAPKPPPPHQPIDDDGWRKMKAKFEGACKWCGKPVKANAPIYWSKDHGAYHPACYTNSKS